MKICVNFCIFSLVPAVLVADIRGGHGAPGAGEEEEGEAGDQGEGHPGRPGGASVLQDNAPNMAEQ